MSRGALIDVKEVVRGIVANIDVGLAVAIDIDEQHAESLSQIGSVFFLLAVIDKGFPYRRHGAQSGFLGYVGECAVAIVVPESVPAAVKLLGGADVVIDLGGVAGAERVEFRERPVYILAQVEIRVTVAVQIAPSCARAPEMLARLA